MSQRIKLFVVLVDCLMFVTGFFVSAVIRLGSEFLLEAPASGYQRDVAVLHAVSLSLVIQMSLFYNSLYDFRSVVATRVLVVRVVAAFGLASLFLALLFYLVPQDLNVGKGVFFIAMLFDVVVFILWRMLLSRYLGTRPLRRILIMGDGDLAEVLTQMVRERAWLGYRCSGRLVPSDEAGAGAEDDDDVIGTYEQLKQASRRTQTDTVVVAMADRRGQMPVSDLLDLKFGGVEVIEGVDLYQQLTERIYIRELKPSWMIFGDGFRQSDIRKVSKRIMDVVASSVGILLASIPMLMTALIVRLSSPGPAIYSQERVGEFGRVFTLYKFRSMRTDSEVAGPQWASHRDPRVTPFGRLIRLTRLDELPQLFNVLVGDMSLVGPRPERPFFVIKLQREIPFFRQRLFVKPGVTGLAQVKFRYAANNDDHVEKLQYDLAYIKNMSILYDIQIILETIKVMLFQRGAH